ncbi:MAG: DNA translocase FtsK 4TM domain-containing protein [Bacteroidales bacterium]|jgi:S-DNA-T family DNA segregation ATPase FtsK/SpoIIIE
MASSATPKKKKKPAVEKKKRSIPGRIKLIFGLFFLFVALFAGISFISYLFSWKGDQSFLDTELSTNLANPDIKVDNLAGKAGAIISNLFIYKWFGISSLILVALFLLYGMALLGLRFLPLLRTSKYGLISMIWISVTLGFALPRGAFQYGGGHGISMAEWLTALMGSAGTLAVIIVSGLAYLVLLFRLTPDHFRRPAVTRFVAPVPDGEANAEDEFIITDRSQDENLIQEIQDKNFSKQIDDLDLVHVEFEPEGKMDMKAPMGDYDPTLELSGYQFPGFDLLRDHSIGHPKVTDEELISNKNKIVETLANYKIKIEKIKATIGPTITLYEIIPAPGVRISKIKNLEDDIALSLSALGIRIIAPIPGRGTIGIEVPNRKPETVSMQTVLASKKFLENDFDLPVALGKTISNETFAFDLAKMPHLLVAGATGQGKSVGINAIITSLLYRKHPSQLKFVMIDPKKVELTLYSKLEKHYLAKLPDFEEPIITDTQHVILVLQSLSAEMDNRYNQLKKAEVRNIKEYNDKFIKRRLNPEKGHMFMPYIVLVIDEFADLIMTAGKEIEIPLTRIAQLARAVGIHMIIATQRPSTNIITGTIKANFPARIAFRVPSMIDSRTILDSPGANHLVGRGDMLVSMGADLIRVQCAYIETDEVEHLTSFIGNQKGYPMAWPLPEPKTDGQDDPGEVSMDKLDELFEEAARLVVTTGQGSTSSIQRKFSIGYNRAGRIMDQLEAAGVVGPVDGSKPRQVYYHDLYTLEKFLNQRS